MNYRHSYHAGNFADVFKHIVLAAIVQSFLRKETAFCYLDTHAGMGKYHLDSDAAQKNKEFESGISRILSQKQPPALIQSYLDCVQSLENLAYPGSPLIVRHFLRPQDRMILSELHPEEFAILKKLFSHDKQTAVHCLDGYQNMKAFLPPKERRGFVLIDPPYEKANEFDTLSRLLPDIVKRWESGVFALWYPIKYRQTVDRFLRAVKTKIHRPTLTTELSIYPENTDLHLNGCGMLIINPPWQLDQELNAILPWLWKTLSVNQQGHYTCTLTP